MNVHILPPALEDLRKGKDFYDLQEWGTGDYFQDSLISDIDRLIDNGGMHRKIGSYHRMISRKFPYEIYYKVNPPDEVFVHRVLDSRRDPKRNPKLLP